MQRHRHCGPRRDELSETVTAPSRRQDTASLYPGREPYCESADLPVNVIAAPAAHTPANRPPGPGKTAANYGLDRTLGRRGVSADTARTDKTRGRLHAPSWDRRPP